jgi:hypothetical protein
MTGREIKESGLYWWTCPANFNAGYVLNGNNPAVQIASVTVDNGPRRMHLIGDPHDYILDAIPGDFVLLRRIVGKGLSATLE